MSLRQRSTSWSNVATHHDTAWLVSLGRGELEDAVREMILQPDGQERVVIPTEFVDEIKRVGHYLASDVVVPASTYEPFGIVATEAIACRKPRVVGAQRLGGHQEQVISDRSSQTGIHVNGNDPNDIAWGLRNALNDRARLQSWGLPAVPVRNRPSHGNKL